MFNVGGGEIIVIALVALIVLGPDKLPDALRKLGQIMGEIRNVSTGFQAEMQSAMRDTDDAPTNPPQGLNSPDTKASQLSADPSDHSSEVPQTWEESGTQNQTPSDLTNNDQDGPAPEKPDTTNNG
ncbi:MAG: twin-arginine translocase TatA/TatE family subunit [Acidimicrobiia bacterium]